MDDFRSKSCKIDSYYGGGGRPAPTSMNDLRSYSTSHASSVVNPPHQLGKEVKIKKGKGNFGSSSLKNWSFNDPELKRKKRVASYKVYAVEGKMKGSMRKSFRWIKETCTQVIYGWH